MSNPDKVIYFAETDARNSRVKFGIKQKDRSRHVYVIGKTGMGKSTLLENMAAQDLQSGNGMCFIDPHGKTAELLLEYVPRERVNDVLYFAPFDMEHPISFNIMEDVGYDKRHLVVSGLMSAFKKIWVDAWSARMEYILSNTLFALLEYPDATLLSVNRMLSDKAFRKKVVDNVKDTAVKSFWVDEFANYTERMAAEAVPAIQNKVGQFTSNPLIRNIIGQPKSSFDIREMMDNGKILIINLSKGRMGESNAQLLGSLLVTKIYLAAMSRADIGPHELDSLPDFSLFVDEFQSFANESFAGILSEARKYKLNLHIAHQYIEQMPEEVKAAVFGNVGTMVTFRVGATDAEAFEKEFAPAFVQEDIVNLGFAQIYLRLMIDGMGSKPFSARTLPPLAVSQDNCVAEVIEASRRQFTRPRQEVEDLVKELTNMGRQEQSSGGGKGNSSGRDGQRNEHENSSSSSNSNFHSGSRDARRDSMRSDSKKTEGHRVKEGDQNHVAHSTQSQSANPQDSETFRSVESKSRREVRHERHERNNSPSNSKPVVSKEKELELKRQIEEAKKRAIDESVESEQVESKQTETLSLTSLSNKKIVSRENKNALKDALLKVLQQNNSESTVEVKVEDKKTIHTETVSFQKDPEQQPQSKHHSEDIQSSRRPIMPGEIPEDELKRLLDVE